MRSAQHVFFYISCWKARNRASLPELANVCVVVGEVNCQPHRKYASKQENPHIHCVLSLCFQSAPGWGSLDLAKTQTQWTVSNALDVVHNMWGEHDTLKKHNSSSLNMPRQIHKWNGTYTSKSPKHLSVLQLKWGKCKKKSVAGRFTPENFLPGPLNFFSPGLKVSPEPCLH